MTVSKYTRPDNTVGGSQYKAAIDAAAHVFERLAAQFACNESDPVDLRVQVRAGTRGDGTEISAQQTAALVAPTTNDRRDIIYLSTAGVVGVQAGTEAASPVDPVLIDDGRIPLARINWTVGQTEITNADLDDLRRAGDLAFTDERTIVKNWGWKKVSEISLDFQRTDEHGDAAIIASHDYKGLNDAGTPEEIDYVSVKAKAVVATDGAEEGQFSVTVQDGTGNTDEMTFDKEGVRVNGATIGGAGGVTVSKPIHMGCDGDIEPSPGGFIGSDGQLYCQAGYQLFGNYWHFGLASSPANSSTNAKGGRFGWYSMGIPTDFYGKVVDAIFARSCFYALTENGFVLGAGYDYQSRLGGGGNTLDLVCMAGPSADIHGNTPALNATVTKMSCSGTRENGAALNDIDYMAILFLTDAGKVWFQGYGNYGNGAGATTNANAGHYVEYSSGNDIEDATDILCCGGQYPRCYIVRADNVWAFGYNATYGALGIGNTTNQSYAQELTSAPDHTTKSGVAKMKSGGYASEGAIWILYGNGELWNAGGCGASGQLGTGDTSHQTTIQQTATDVADFWPARRSTIATTGGQSWLRKITGNVMQFAGNSGPSNCPALGAASTNYTTWQTLTGDIWASVYAEQLYDPGYNGANDSWYCFGSDGKLYANGADNTYRMGVNSSNSAFTTGQWEVVPVALDEGDSYDTDDRSSFECGVYSYENTLLKTTNGKLFQGPSGLTAGGPGNADPTQKYGVFQQVYGGATTT